MSIIKKLTAAVASLAIAFSLTACSDVSWACKINGTELKAGVYIYYEIMGKDAATSILSKQNFTDDIFTQSLDGKDMKTYIRDYAMDKCKRAVATNSMFDELGLTLSETDKKTIKKTVDDTWEQNGDKFTKFGVSKQSLTYIVENRTKENLVFEKYYGEGGLEAVSNSEINAQIPKDYARIKFIPFSIVDSTTGMKYEASKLAEIEKTAQGYVDRALKGEDFNKIIAEYTNNSFQQSVSDGNTDKYKNEVIVSNGYQSIEPDSVTEILKHTKNNDTFIVKGTTTYYVVNKLDILQRDDVTSQLKKAELVPLRADTFTAKVKAKYDAYTIEMNKAAFDKYDPQVVANRG